MNYDNENSGDEGDDDDDDDDDDEDRGRGLNAGQLYTAADHDVAAPRSKQKSVTESGSGRRQSVNRVTYIDTESGSGRRRSVDRLTYIDNSAGGDDVNAMSSDCEAAMLRRPSGTQVVYVGESSMRESESVRQPVTGGQQRGRRRDDAAQLQVS